MPQARHSIEVNVSAERMFGVITDFEKYPEFLPEMKRVTIISQSDHRKVVEFDLEMLKIGMHYSLRFEEEPFRSVRWSMVSATWLKAVDGYWQIESGGPDRCLVTYFNELTFKGLLPKFVTTKLADLTLPRMLENFKERAERLK